MNSNQRFKRWTATKSGQLGAGSIALLLAVFPPAYAQERTYTFDVPSQPLSSALLTLGRQGSISILAPNSLVDGKTAPVVKGELSVKSALDQLLFGSGLRADFIEPDAVRIMVADRAQPVPASGTSPTPATVPTRTLGDVSDPDSDRVIVTGTNLTGVYPSASPVAIYTAEDIQKTGATTAEQFVGKLPQNLGTFSQYAPGSTVNATNPNGVTSVDLRGLGVGTTLTLINGRRIASSNSGQSVDVSLIPVSAIERVEVLTDGASAIYGSDAIGGVINFVLKDDLEGGETRISYGGVSSGGMTQGDASQTFGTHWDGGRGLFGYNFHSASALSRLDRSYSAPAGEGTLAPEDIRHNAFMSLRQDFGLQLHVDVDAGYTWRKVKNTFTRPFPGIDELSTFNTYGSTTKQAFGAIGAVYDISDETSLRVDMSYSDTDVDGERATLLFNQSPLPPPDFLDFSTEGSSLDVTVKLEGRLFEVPGGTARYSVGGGALEEKFRGISPVTEARSAGQLGRRTIYGFGEAFFPILSASQKLPFAQRLELSLAARYTDYEDISEPSAHQEFGSSIDPKVGLLWSPAEDFALRGTYGQSFRAPSLTQLDPTSGAHYIFGTPVAGVNSFVLGLVSYPDGQLQPETAETFTVGFDYEPQGIAGFRISGTYYNIDYTDRIGTAPTGGLNPFSDPSLLPDVIYRPPSAAFLEEALRATPLFFGINASGIDLTDPNAAAAALFALPNLWVYDVRARNLAVSEQDGFDIEASQTFSNELGDFSVTGNVSRILRYKQQTSPSSTLQSATDIAAGPPDLRGRLSLAWSKGDLQANLGVNYVDDYTNRHVAGEPKVDSWTTVDLSIGYEFPSTDAGTETGVGINLSVQNLFDEDPPFMGDGSGGALLAPIGFDPVNANPLGRLIILGVSKKW